MKKKLASVLLCAVMAASMLTGCGNADNATATTPATDNKTDVAATTEAAEKTAEKTADRKSTRLNSSHKVQSRMPSSA